MVRPKSSKRRGRHRGLAIGVSYRPGFTVEENDTPYSVTAYETLEVVAFCYGPSGSHFESAGTLSRPQFESLRLGAEAVDVDTLSSIRFGMDDAPSYHLRFERDGHGVDVAVPLLLLRLSSASGENRPSQAIRMALRLWNLILHYSPWHPLERFRFEDWKARE